MPAIFLDVRRGAYEILGEIGRGGMGVVYRARGPDGGVVALKVLHRTATATATARFGRERRLLATLGEDKGFVSLLDEGESEEGPFLVMPFVAGGTLRERIEKQPLDLRAAIALAVSLAKALGAAHEQGIVHRDVKPENVLFTADGRPLVSDLGLAKHYRLDAPGASQSIALSREGVALGTPRYMAPEQATGAKDVGAQADVFALGAILYECLAGKPAFAGDSLSEVILRMAGEHYEPLRAVRPDAPRWLQAVVSRALAAEPAKRFPDANALAAALEAGEGTRRLPLAVASAVAVLAVAVVALGSRTSNRNSLGEAAQVSTTTTVEATGPPAWYLALRASDRPALPLPAGLRLGDAPGEYVNEKDGSVLVYVPAGAFSMGSDEGEENERPVHEVFLSAYFMGKYEATVAQFARFAKETGFVTAAEKEGAAAVKNPEGSDHVPREGAWWRFPQGDGREAPANHPVSQISWREAVAYCRWAGLALPSEAQWERAAGWDPERHHARRYAWGDEVLGAGSPPVANVADAAAHRRWPTREWFEGYDDGFEGAAPVGSFPRGVSPCGALDMTGNVSEWCRDTMVLGFYAATRGARDPCAEGAPDADSRMVRGEDWLGRPSYARVARRSIVIEWARVESTGFRVARPAR